MVAGADRRSPATLVHHRTGHRVRPCRGWHLRYVAAQRPPWTADHCGADVQRQPGAGGGQADCRGGSRRYRRAGFRLGAGQVAVVAGAGGGRERCLCPASGRLAGGEAVWPLRLQRFQQQPETGIRCGASLLAGVAGSAGRASPPVAPCGDAGDVGRVAGRRCGGGRRVTRYRSGGGRNHRQHRRRAGHRCLAAGRCRHLAGFHPGAEGAQ